jgi:hypothetical protein
VLRSTVLHCTVLLILLLQLYCILQNIIYRLLANCIYKYYSPTNNIIISRYLLVGRSEGRGARIRGPEGQQQHGTLAHTFDLKSFKCVYVYQNPLS